jgi:hypothetical protein
MRNILEELKNKIEIEKDADAIFILKDILRNLEGSLGNYDYNIDLFNIYFFKKKLYFSIGFFEDVLECEKNFEGYLKYLIKKTKILIDLKVSIIINIKIETASDRVKSKTFEKLETEINKLIKSNEWTHIIGVDDPIYDSRFCRFRRTIELRKIKGYKAINNKKRLNLFKKYN